MSPKASENPRSPRSPTPGRSLPSSSGRSRTPGATAGRTAVPAGASRRSPSLPRTSGRLNTPDTNVPLPPMPKLSPNARTSSPHKRSPSVGASLNRSANKSPLLSVQDSQMHPKNGEQFAQDIKSFRTRLERELSAGLVNVLGEQRVEDEHSDRITVYARKCPLTPDGIQLFMLMMFYCIFYRK